MRDGYDETPGDAAVSSRYLDELMRTERFIIQETTGAFLTEDKGLGRQEGQIPQENRPVTSAVRHGLRYLKRAVRLLNGSKRLEYPDLAMP